jgi:hypothetical protein
MKQIERVLSLLEALQDQGQEADARVVLGHAKDGYALMLVSPGHRGEERSVSVPINGFPWIDYREPEGQNVIRYFKSVDLAIDDAMRALEAALKNKVEVLEHEATAARKTLG